MASREGGGRRLGSPRRCLSPLIGWQRIRSASTAADAAQGSRRCQTAILRRSLWISETPSHRACSQHGAGAQRRPPRLPPSTPGVGRRRAATVASRPWCRCCSSIQTADIRSNGPYCLQTAVNKICTLACHSDHTNIFYKIPYLDHNY
jgi:hypothetical protein